MATRGTKSTGIRSCLKAVCSFGDQGELLLPIRVKTEGPSVFFCGDLFFGKNCPVRLRPVDLMGEHPVLIKVKVPLEGFSLEHSRQPLDVVGPHVVIRDLARLHPVGDGLVCLDRFPEASLCRKNDAVEGESVDELEVEFPPFT